MTKRKALGFFMALLLLLQTFGALEMPAYAEGGPVAAVSADSIVDSIGINTHLFWTYNVYENFEQYRQKLIDLGVRYVREQLAVGFQTQRDRLTDLYNSAGIKTFFILDPRGQGGQPQEMLNYAKTYGMQNYTAAFEGPNEYDSSSGDSNWAENLKNYQMAAWEVFKSDPATKDLPLIGPSLVFIPEIQGRDSFAALGDISAYCDGGNVHPYPGGDDVPTHWSGIFKNHSKKNVGEKPVWVTETGYHNATTPTSGHLGVSEAAESKYVNRLILDFYQQGFVKTFKYELISQGTDPNDIEHHFGLLRSDYSEKPAYTALKNMIDLLKDPGSSFTPGSLDYTISGDTDKVKSLLMQKRDGTYYLALWSDERVYDADDTKEDLNPADKAITLTFNENVSVAETYLPRVSTDAVDTFSNPASLNLNVPAEVLIVKISKPLLKNGGFENGNLADWTVTGTNSAGTLGTGDPSWTAYVLNNSSEAHGGNSYLQYYMNTTEYGAYTTSVSQTVTGLVNGTYKLTAWGRGAVSDARLEAKDFGGAGLSANVPGGSWSLLTVNNIKVTNGQCTVALTVSDNTSGWCNFDDVELTLIEAASYSMSASVLDSFGALQLGYTQPDAQTVTITNTGTGDITLIQPTAANYDLGALSGTSLPAGGSVTLTVRPKENLPVGGYNDVITISGTNGEQVSFITQFAVTPINMLTNPGFEADLAGWTQIRDTANWVETGSFAHGGSKFITFYSANPFDSGVSQTVTGLTNGVYTLRAWVNSTNGHDHVRLEAMDYGGEPLYANRTGAEYGWKLVTLDDIIVTNGQCTVVLATKFSAPVNPQNHSQFDDVELVLKQAASTAIEVSTPENFGSLPIGYTDPPTAQTVTITNTGSEALTLNQPTAESYDIGTLSDTNLAAEGGTATFTICPKMDLPAGQYNETITVSSSSGESASFVARFTVIPSNPIKNPGFETGDLTNWTVSGTVDGTGDPSWVTYVSTDPGSAHGGNSYLSYWMDTAQYGAYVTSVSQTVTGLVNGTYKLTAWARGADSLTYARLEAKDFGGEDLYTNMPNGDWSQLIINDIIVTDGQLTVALTVSDNSSGWCTFDDVELTLIEAASYSISASDLSDFGTSQVGYTTPDAQTVTITNNGTGDITLIQPTAENYAIGTLSNTTLAVGGLATFTVCPQADLPAGIYNETITVGSVEGATVNVNARFAVMSPNLILDWGFESGDLTDYWDISGTGNYSWPPFISNNASNAHGGNRYLEFWMDTAQYGAYVTSVSQTVTDLPNGIYKLTAWGRSANTLNYARLEAKDFGGTDLYADVSSGSWSQLTIGDIIVTNGQLTVALTVSDNSSGWCTFDDVELVMLSEIPTPPVITSASSYTCTEGTGGSFNLAATGTAPIAWSIMGEPAGVTVSGNTLIVAGTVAANTYTFTVKASNGIAPDAEQSFTLTVTPNSQAFVDKSVLSAAIAVADALVKANYTSKSWTKFESALNAAKLVSADDDATQAAVDAALLELNLAKAALESSQGVTNKPASGKRAGSSVDGDSGSMGANTLSGTGSPQPVDKTAAIGEAKKAASGNGVARFKNAGAITLDIMKAMANAANGKLLRVNADSMNRTGNAVEVRISFYPKSATKDINLSGSISSAAAQARKKQFEKYFSGKIRVIHLEQKGNFGMIVEIAAKVDLADMDKKNLYFYSYDESKNTYTRIMNTKYWIDSNGYLHFNTSLAGDIIISEGPLELKKV